MSRLYERYRKDVAPELGREEAHDLVYAAALASKQRRIELRQALVEIAADPRSVVELSPADYLGQARDEAIAAVAEWTAGPPA